MNELTSINLKGFNFQQLLEMGHLENVIQGMIKRDKFKITKSRDLIKDGFLLPKGDRKLKRLGLILPNECEERVMKLREFFEKGILLKDDFTDFYIDLEYISGVGDFVTKELIKNFQLKQIEDSGVKFDVISGLLDKMEWTANEIFNTYGTPLIKKQIHSDLGGTATTSYSPTCIIATDIITSGGLTIETAKNLRASNIIVNDVFTFLDRKQGAVENFAKLDPPLKLHAVMDMDSLRYLTEKNMEINYTNKNEK